MYHTPFISVVIPCYNRASFLSETIRSVLGQTYADFELILVDDGSTDNTAEVIAQHKDERLRYVFQENQERGAARNTGFNKAHGKYVFFFDSDDIMLENHLEIIHKGINDFNFPSLIASKYQLKRGDKIIDTGIATLEPGLVPFEVLLKGNPFATLFCVRKDTKRLILFEESRELASMEDWIFLLRNRENHDLVLLPDITIYMQDHDSRSMANNALVIERRINALEFLKKKLKLSSDQKEHLELGSYWFCAIHAYLDKKYGASLDYLSKIQSWSMREKKLRLKIFLAKFGFVL